VHAVHRHVGAHFLVKRNPTDPAIRNMTSPVTQSE
jgi:hypothetical protein